MSSKSTVSAGKRKAGNGKPRPDFPLFPHASGRWAKKVRGKFRYLGKIVDDPKGVAALEMWLERGDTWRAGREWREDQDGLTIRKLLNRFLTSKKHLVDNGELAARTFADYHATAARLIDAFGKTRMVSDLASDDFEHLRVSIAKTRGPVALGNEIQRIRVIFKYAYDAGLIDNPVRYGPTFKRPSRKVLRKARNEKGARMFDAAQIQQLLSKASTQMRAMILLGINCGFGNHDVGTLPQSALDLDGGWVTYPRPKTGIIRRCPLWQETVAAIREALVDRPAPKKPSDAGLVFITKYGHPWANDTPASPVGKEATKLLITIGIHRPGLGFYALRHSFQTIGGDTADQVAVDHIMGHVDPSMAANYRHRIDDERLKKVVQHVHSWLFQRILIA